MTAILLAGLAAAAIAGPADWSAVERLEPGLLVEITLDESKASERRLASVDEHSITLLAPGFHTLPRRIRRFVQRCLEAMPDAVQRIAKGTELQEGDLVLSIRGVGEAGRQIAALADVFQTIPSSSVVRLQVETPARRRNALLGGFLAIPHGLMAGQGLSSVTAAGILGEIAMAIAVDAGIGAMMPLGPRLQLVYER